MHPDVRTLVDEEGFVNGFRLALTVADSLDNVYDHNSDSAGS